jgi:AcrR family transcriptional regulator
MAGRKPRADAQRNREAVLAAADALFADGGSRNVSMDDIAAAAGVGKGTLFRRFGDRTGLIRALFSERIDSLRREVETGPPPLGPGASPHQRIPALLEAVLDVKLANRHLSLALEEAGADTSPYQGHYTWCHGVLRDALVRLPGEGDPDFTAHVLLAATRADLVEHLLGEQHMSPECIRASLAAFVAVVLGGSPSA